ncbi:MAG: FmdB family zinc ribbon protein [Alkalispirochaeta sp.]
MPTYDYQCDSCGHVFETMQSMKDAPLSVCPECENAALRRLISGGAGVIFKGSGFYVNDSRKTGSGGASTASQKATSDSGTSDPSTTTPAGDGAKKDGSKKDAPAADSSKKSA